MQAIPCVTRGTTTTTTDKKKGWMDGMEENPNKQPVNGELLPTNHFHHLLFG